MPISRKNQVSLSDTPFYHCVSRCVRRAFLCGKDPVTGKSFEHRRGWIEKRILFLAKVFAIDVCAYAVMSNHTHVVLHVDEESSKKWSSEEVIQRWHRVSHGNFLSKMWLDTTQRSRLNSTQQKTLDNYVCEWRSRLANISWFMRMLNEPIARKANEEDQCTGRFWEGRFKSQALLDETAIVSCMAYVDLNPIRAKKANTPENSHFTSLKRRISDLKTRKSETSLMRFAEESTPTEAKHASPSIPIPFQDYLHLIDTTGRVIRDNTSGYINGKMTGILERIGLKLESWTKLCTGFEKHFSGGVGKELALRNYSASVGSKRVHGLSQSRALMG